MDHGEDGGQVALPGPHEEQPVDVGAGAQLLPLTPPGRAGSGEGPGPSTRLPAGLPGILEGLSWPGLRNEHKEESRRTRLGPL